MPLSVRQLSDIRRSVTIPVEDDALHIVYRLGAINIELSDWLDAHGADRGSLMEWIARVVVQWDIEDDEGRPLPPTVEALEQSPLPTPILRLILDAVYEDASPPNLKMNSSATQRLDLGARRNGIKST